MTQPLIKLENLSRTYVTEGGVQVKALKRINLEINRGEFVAIMGQSGSGKSTLMNILGCLDKPTGGSYFFMDRNISSYSQDELAALRREAFGFIFQSYNLLNNENAINNVQIPAIYKAIPNKQRYARAKDLLDSLGLGDRLDHRPMELSGGQQQRVSIARAMMNGASVILADEPTGALDSNSGQEVLALLKKLSEEGKTVILITHDKQIASYANRIISIKDGEIVGDEDRNTSKQAVQDNNDELIQSDSHKLVILSSIKEAYRMAISSLRSNLFRTILTLLGIVIGVSSVVTLMAVGEGAQQNIIRVMEQLGTNVLTLRPERLPNSRRNMPSTLTVSDAQRISNEVPNVIAAIPQKQLGNATVRFGGLDTNTTVVATTENMPTVNSWSLSQGIFFSDADGEELAPIAVLGSEVRSDLFPGGMDPIGQFILVNNVPFQIIGLLNEKGAQGWNNPDDAIYIPYQTGVFRLFGQQFADEIRILVEDADVIEQTQENILEFVRYIHSANDVRINQNTAMLESASEATATITILLGAVAAISLIVGGIGVMNIMLVSVTERTREIGIRMATGARQFDILMQFLTESVVVSIIGGVLGVIIGIGLALLISSFQIPIFFSNEPMLYAFFCSVSIGIIFGFTPARKASKLDPVVALSND
ncbi:MAG: MacB family efflux pump subunit [Betaproteobacteria bacterium]